MMQIERYSESKLKAMKKTDLIETIRNLEDELQSLQDMNDNQFKLLNEKDPLNALWIPATEKLPDKTLRCIVTVKTNGALTVRYSNFVVITETVHFWTGFLDKNVVAWMPLPEPYTGV